MTLRRITLAAALALVPVLRAADANLEDWLHDNLNNRALWLYGSNNLGFETAPADLPPRTPGKRWVLNRDGRTAAVVYFVPGDIQSVEVDTHRAPDATGDFSLSVSADGKFWQPLTAVAAPLEDAAGWQFRLLAADVVPPHQMHLRVEFPAGATAKTHRLTEVWVRFKWHETLVDPAAPKNTADAAKPAAGSTPTSSDASSPTVVAKPAIAAAASASTPAVAETAPAAREAIVVFGETKPTAIPAAPRAIEAVTATPESSATSTHDEAARTRELQENLRQSPNLLAESAAPSPSPLASPQHAAQAVSTPSAERTVVPDAAAPIATRAPSSAAESLEGSASPAAVGAASPAEFSPSDATFTAPRIPEAADVQSSVPAASVEVKPAAPVAPELEAKPVKPAKKKFVQRGRIGPRSK